MITTWTLVILMHYWTSSMTTSVTIQGYATMESCQESAMYSLKRKGKEQDDVLDAFCLAKLEAKP